MATKLKGVRARTSPRRTSTRQGEAATRRRAVRVRAGDKNEVQKGRNRPAQEAAIIAAAERVFAGAGFNGATMAEIAMAAGLPKPNLHYYFGNKRVITTYQFVDNLSYVRGAHALTFGTNLRYQRHIDDR